VDALDIPVIGNGDVWTGEDARRMWEHTGCAGIMIARGSHGRPWIFAHARAALEGRPIPPEPGLLERVEVVLEHARNAIAFEADEERAMIEFRKHLGWYTKGLEDGRALRQELFQIRRLEEVERILEDYLSRHAGVAAGGGTGFTGCWRMWRRGGSRRRRRWSGSRGHRWRRWWGRRGWTSPSPGWTTIGRCGRVTRRWCSGRGRRKRSSWTSAGVSRRGGTGSW